MRGREGYEWEAPRLRSPHREWPSWRMSSAFCLWCSDEIAPPPREVIRSLQAVPCTLHPKPRKSITQGPCYLKKEGKNLATRAPNNNQQLTNLFF